MKYPVLPCIIYVDVFPEDQNACNAADWVVHVSKISPPDRLASRSWGF